MISYLLVFLFEAIAKLICPLKSPFLGPLSPSSSIDPLGVDLVGWIVAVWPPLSKGLKIIDFSVQSSFAIASFGICFFHCDLHAKKNKQPRQSRSFVDDSLAEEWMERKIYSFSSEPIDVVIPAVEKDLETLDLCIDGIRDYGIDVRRVIVVSAKPLTKKAEWFDEALFPFSKQDVAFFLAHKDDQKAQELLSAPQCRIGWYLQQLLKLYAAFVIPGISSNVLVLDSDVIFLRPVQFLTQSHAGLYVGGDEHWKSYFRHAERLLPGFRKILCFSGIAHHMVLQKCVLEDLFYFAEKHHSVPLWQAFCLCVDPADFFIGASEYELYANFVFKKTNQVRARALLWKNVDSITDLERYHGCFYVACHSWMRK